MNNHKLRLLPLFILITGLVTLTAGCKKKDMSLKLNEPRNIRGVVSYKRSFPDLNDKHLAVAQAVGICPPEDRDAAEKMKEQLIHITDNQFYTVDSLTHSIPYLVPRASELLDTIGSNFLDSLTAKGLNPNQIIVTSVLRSQSDVKRLRRRNGNASANSAHCYGATFDVSWKRFKKVEDEDGRPLQDMIPAAKLKEYMELNIIQIAPLAFMRGRTLNDAVVILDEAQNTTAQQIKMFLTRMGMNTKMIVTGDMTQIDLPASQTSGLVQALRILKGVKGISFVELNKKDIVRHKLVERIVDAYEKFDKEAKAEREKRKNEQLVINGERPVKQVNN